MQELLTFIDRLLDFLIFLIIAAAVMSWLVAFDIINRRNQAVRMVGDLLYQLTEPLFRPIRRRLPDFGSIDISPLVLIFIIWFIQIVIIPNLRKLFPF
jgi:YggT family protein